MQSTETQILQSKTAPAFKELTRVREQVVNKYSYPRTGYWQEHKDTESDLPEIGVRDPERIHKGVYS